jgi:HD superfamily phosphohydrolase YqeK
MTPHELAVRSTALRLMRPDGKGAKDADASKIAHDEADEFRDYMRNYGLEHDWWPKLKAF